MDSKNENKFNLVLKDRYHHSLFEFNFKFLQLLSRFVSTNCTNFRNKQSKQCLAFVFDKIIYTFKPRTSWSIAGLVLFTCYSAMFHMFCKIHPISFETISFHVICINILIDFIVINEHRKVIGEKSTLLSQRKSKYI